jgi:hypothetical protein
MLSSSSNFLERSKTKVDKLINQLLKQPTWFKSYIYFTLRNDLKKTYDIEFLNSRDENNLVHNYVPSPSASGRTLIQRKFNKAVISFELDDYQIKFLKQVGYNKKLIDICNENNWSLADGARLLVEVIEKGYIESIEITSIANQIYYLAGKIRLGEYLLRTNKISLDQIDRALSTQRDIVKNMGQNVKIGDLLVNLGFINEGDKSDIIQLKENSYHPCHVEDQTEDLRKEIEQLKASMETLSFENESLKQDVVYFQDELIEKSKVIVALEDKVKGPESIMGKINKLFCLSW